MEWNNTLKGTKDMETKISVEMPLIPCAEPLDMTPASLDKENGYPAPKPKKKSMTSVFLKYFETATDGKSRQCKICKQSYSIATATGNLGRHLNHRHPGYDKEGDHFLQSPDDSIFFPKKPSSLPKPFTLESDNLNWLLLKWCIESSISHHLLQNTSFLTSLKLLNSSPSLWPPEKFHAAAINAFISLREEVKALLDLVVSKFSIALDFWTSHEDLYYMLVSCHWIDDNWFPRKVVLDVCRIPYPCSGLDIFHAIAEVLRIYDLEKKILSCNNDSSIQQAVIACHALKDEFDGRKTPFFFVPSAAHALNQIIDDALRSPKPILSKIREFALDLKTSQRISQDFKHLEAIHQEGSSKTWNGTYAMLDLARKASISMDDQAFGGRIASLNATEKSVVNILHSYLEPFHKITSNLSSCRAPTLGLVLFFMDHVFELIGSCRDACRQEWLKSISDDMAKRASNFSSQAYHLFTYMAAVLDPRIKKELIPEKLNSDKNLEEARNHFTRHYSSSSIFINGVHSQFMEEDVAVSFAEEIARKRRRVSMSMNSDELSQYLSEPPAPIVSDALEWWRANGSRYPRLSAMARDYLAVQGSSVDPEELFSSKGDQIKKMKYCLPYGSMQAAMCIKSWSQSEFNFKFKFRSSETN